MAIYGLITIILLVVCIQGTLDFAPATSQDTLHDNNDCT